MSAEHSNFPALGPSTVLGAAGMSALGLSFVFGGGGDIKDTWGEESMAAMAAMTLMVAAISVVCFVFAYRLLRSGVFMRDSKLIVRQLSRTRTFAREDIRAATVGTAANLFRPAAVLDLDLADRQVRCQLYGRYLKGKNALVVAEFVNAWRTSESGERGDAI